MLRRTPFDERLKPTTFGETIKICKSIKVKKVEYIYVYVLAHCMEHSGALFFFFLQSHPTPIIGTIAIYTTYVML